MSTVMTRTCKYCGRKFRNEKKATEHEIEELVAHNPRPLYCMTVSPLSIHHYSHDYNEHYFSIEIERELSLLNNKGQHVDIRWNNDYESVEEALNESREYRMYEPVGKWKYNHQEKSTCDGLYSQLFKESNRNGVSYWLYFDNWEEMPKYLEQLKAFFRDTEWYDSFREYYQNFYTNVVKEQLDYQIDRMIEILTTKPLFGTVRFPFKKHEQMSYNLQEECDMFVDWYFREYETKKAPARKESVVMKTEVKYQCDLCNKSFDTQEELDKHYLDTHKCINAYCLEVPYMDWCLTSTNRNRGDRFELHSVKLVYGKPEKDSKEDVWYMSHGYYNQQFEGLDSVDDVFKQLYYEKDWHTLAPVDDSFEFDDYYYRPNHVLFRNKSEICDAFKRMSSALRPKVDKTIKNRLSEYEKGFDTLKTMFNEEAPMLIDLVGKHADSIRKGVDSIGKLEVIVYGTGKFKCATGNADLRHETTLADKSFDLDAIIGNLIEKKEVQKKKEEEEKKAVKEKKKYSKSDIFLMNTEIDWADEIMFFSASVINGEQRNALEEKLNDKEAQCHLSFGTNEYGTYPASSIKATTKFKKITAAQKKVLSELGLLDTGNVSYSQIMEGFEQDDDEDTED